VLKKKVGERITYQDEWGQPFEVELAGTIPGSIFQGQLVVDEQKFLERYPGAEGYRLFLVDAGGELEAGKAVIQSALQDRGAQVMTTAERLAAFYGVENTYIAIFNVLGGLGVLLGSAGLGIVTARNLSERRREFALMNTLGIPREATREVVFREVRRLIGWGLGIGLLAALLSIIPHLQAQGWEQTLPWVAGLVLAIAANAWFWSWLGFRRNLKAAHLSRQEFV
jgi:ABC-type antimicrobial peptide transport system permease subunit